MDCTWTLKQVSMRTYQALQKDFSITEGFGLADDGNKKTEIKSRTRRYNANQE
jgi:hypothetical protein